MNDNELAVDESVEKAISLLTQASRVDPGLRAAVGVVDDAVRSLRERNTRLGVLRHEAENVVDRMRVLVDEHEHAGRGLNVEGEAAVTEFVDAARIVLDGAS